MWKAERSPSSMHSMHSTCTSSLGSLSLVLFQLSQGAKKRHATADPVALILQTRRRCGGLGVTSACTSGAAGLSTCAAWRWRPAFKVLLRFEVGFLRLLLSSSGGFERFGFVFANSRGVMKVWVLRAFTVARNDLAFRVFSQSSCFPYRSTL